MRAQGTAATSIGQQVLYRTSFVSGKIPVGRRGQGCLQFIGTLARPAGKNIGEADGGRAGAG